MAPALPLPARQLLIGPITAVLVVACLLTLPAAADPEIRISNLSVFLNDLDVTVQVVLLGAIPPSLHESLHSGVAIHVRFHVELWQYSRFWVERRVQVRVVERQLTYNVLTKEYKVASLAGEPREPYLTKNLREAQRVASDLRVSRLAPVSSLDAQELYYVRVRADVSLGGVNSWVARIAGDAAETPWVQSSLLTVNRSQ
ncbi:MAG: DUF4390 domain-containing protein [Candidatus Rokubacteria bacterium]|nr:DUF4390 domain-containing protein [Candidatus Rokubacteria bacterium]